MVGWRGLVERDGLSMVRRGAISVKAAAAAARVMEREEGQRVGLARWSARKVSQRRVVEVGDREARSTFLPVPCFHLPAAAGFRRALPCPPRRRAPLPRTSLRLSHCAGPEAVVVPARPPR